MSIQVVLLATESVITASVSLNIYFCIPKHLDTDILLKKVQYYVCNNKPLTFSKVFVLILGLTQNKTDSQLDFVNKRTRVLGLFLFQKQLFP